VSNSLLFIKNFVLDSIPDKLDKKDLIFTSSSKKALEKYREPGIDTGYANYAHPEQLAYAFKGGDTLLMISMPQVGKKNAGCIKMPLMLRLRQE